LTLKLVYAFAEGNKDLKNLLGGKGANLAEMTRLGIPVPPGFIITTDACKEYLANNRVPLELDVQVTRALRKLEDECQKRFGDSENPLLISVRSGAKNSMPGMMETILNVGLNDKSVVSLGMQTGNEKFAWDAYRRLIQMYGKTVLGIEGAKFAKALDESIKFESVLQPQFMTVDGLKTLVDKFKKIVRSESGEDFPQNPREQLDRAISAVFESWNTERAKLYRRRERIPDDLGTAVNVVAMVFGNMGDDSGTGVCFTRDPATGENGAYGDYLPNAQGEDVVSGTSNTLTLEDFKNRSPKLFDELKAIMYKLETHYRDICDIEFTVERGRLWILQTRVAKRTPAAAFRIAIQLVDEQLITMDEALMRVTGNQLAQLMFPQFVKKDDVKPIAIGIPASPGAAVGRAAFSSAHAVERADRGEKVILIRRETNPDDLGGMLASVGILTSRGGKTSHAAVVARGVGKTAVCGAESIEVNEVNMFAQIGEIRINDGDLISIDGLTGEIFNLEVPVAPSLVETYLLHGITTATNGKDQATQDLIRSIDRLLRHADRRRRLMVRANCDTSPDSDTARRFGAEGIGLCRTEHMFLGDKRILIERVILADSQEKRDEVFAVLLPMQRREFSEIMEVMDGLVTTIRLLDPPLHEFLPDLGDLRVRVAIANERGESTAEDEELLQAVGKMHETNPMLGLRGVRLGLVFAGLYELQVRAIAEAMADRISVGGNPKVEIMIPLVGSHMELKLTRQLAEKVIKEVELSRRVELPVDIGTMIELPRAALTANRIGLVADFFSFGTNDLTQTTWGFSRDDVEAEFFSRYLELGIFTVSPFETLDEFGVGELISIAIERGRSSNPNIHLGVCGEHGGDPESIHFFHAKGLDYVSCSPYRVPIARLEAGRASLAAI